jgi:uncharacterized protein (TIGR02147 family)
MAMPPSVPNAPSASNVFEFADFRKFLEDHQAKRQAADRTFTRARFCKELGLPNTRSFFNDIVKGTRHLSRNYVDRFTLALGLDEEEAQYFRVMVDFNQSENPRDREMLFDRLVSLNRTPSRFIKPEEYEFYRRWHHTTIFSLLDVIDFKGDHAALAKRVLPRITAAQARESIALLKKLGLIRRDESGAWKPASKTLDAGAYVRSALVQQYQLQCLELSKRAMLAEGPAPRNFSTVTLSVSKRGLGLIERKLQRFKSEARSIAHREAEPADRVYQLNIQFFPQALPEKSP